MGPRCYPLKLLEYLNFSFFIIKKETKQKSSLVEAKESNGSSDELLVKFLFCGTMSSEALLGIRSQEHHPTLGSKNSFKRKDASGFHSLLQWSQGQILTIFSFVQ